MQWQDPAKFTPQELLWAQQLLASLPPAERAQYAALPPAGRQRFLQALHDHASAYAGGWQGWTSQEHLAQWQAQWQMHQLQQHSWHIAADGPQSPLLQAALLGDAIRVDFLLRTGVTVHDTGSSGETAAHWAASAGHVHVLNFLLDAGAPVDAPDDMGQAPLHWAAAAGSLPAIQCLWDAGADALAADVEGYTARQVALYEGQQAAAKLLLKLERQQQQGQQEGQESAQPKQAQKESQKAAQQKQAGKAGPAGPGAATLPVEPQAQQKQQKVIKGGPSSTDAEQQAQRQASAGPLRTPPASPQPKAGPSQAAAKVLRVAKTTKEGDKLVVGQQAAAHRIGAGVQAQAVRPPALPPPPPLEPVSPPPLSPRAPAMQPAPELKQSHDQKREDRGRGAEGSGAGQAAPPDSEGSSCHCRGSPAPSLPEQSPQAASGSSAGSGSSNQGGSSNSGGSRAGSGPSTAASPLRGPLPAPLPVLPGMRAGASSSAAAASATGTGAVAAADAAVAAQAGHAPAPDPLSHVLRALGLSDPSSSGSARRGAEPTVPPAAGVAARRAAPAAQPSCSAGPARVATADDAADALRPPEAFFPSVRPPPQAVPPPQTAFPAQGAPPTAEPVQPSAPAAQQAPARRAANQPAIRLPALLSELLPTTAHPQPQQGTAQPLAEDQPQAAAAEGSRQPTAEPSSPAKAQREPLGSAARADPAADAELVCPITFEAMRDPVTAADGHTYERAAIQAWFWRQQAKGLRPCSPLTNLPLEDLRLLPNQAVKQRVASLRAAGLLAHL